MAVELLAGGEAEALPSEIGKGAPLDLEGESNTVTTCGNGSYSM